MRLPFSLLGIAALGFAATAIGEYIHHTRLPTAGDVPVAEASSPIPTTELARGTEAPASGQPLLDFHHPL